MEKYVLVCKNSVEVLRKLKSRVFRATCLFIYDFTTLISHYPMIRQKKKLIDLIERAFKFFYKNYGILYLACKDRKAFSTSSDHRGYTLWSCQNECDV